MVRTSFRHSDPYLIWQEMSCGKTRRNESCPGLTFNSNERRQMERMAGSRVYSLAGIERRTPRLIRMYGVIHFGERSRIYTLIVALSTRSPSCLCTPLPSLAVRQSASWPAPLMICRAIQSSTASRSCSCRHQASSRISTIRARMNGWRTTWCSG